MRLFLLLLFSTIFYAGQAQKIVVDYMMTMDESQTWPFTWDIAIDDESTLYTGNESGRLYMKKLDEEWEEILIPDEEDNDIRKIEFDGNGSLWVATNGSGIFRLKDDVWTNFTMENSAISTNNFRYLVASNDGRIYAAGSEGLNIFSNGTWVVLNEGNSSFEKDDIDALEYNPTTNKVLVGDNGFFYSIQGTTIVKKVDLDSDFGWMTWVTSLYAFEDKVYIGTETGLYLFENNQVKDMTSIFDDRNVSDITMDNEGNLWLGEVFYGLHVYDGNTLHSIGSTDTLPTQIFDMVTFGDNVLTVGNRGARLAASHFESPVAVDEVSLMKLKIYPTIVDQYLTIETKIPNTNDMNSVLYNSVGEIVSKGAFQKRINMENLPSGIYYLILQNQNGKMTSTPSRVVKR